MPTITSGLSPMNLRAICAAVPVLPWALWVLPLEVLAVFVAGLLEGLLDPSRAASSAGCSTMAVTATDLCSSALAPKDRAMPRGQALRATIYSCRPASCGDLLIVLARCSELF